MISRSTKRTSLRKGSAFYRLQLGVRLLAPLRCSALPGSVGDRSSSRSREERSARTPRLPHLREGTSPSTPPFVCDAETQAGGRSVGGPCVPIALAIVEPHVQFRSSKSSPMPRPLSDVPTRGRRPHESGEIDRPHAQCFTGGLRARAEERLVGCCGAVPRGFRRPRPLPSRWTRARRARLSRPSPAQGLRRGAPRR
jgi:hypothetical protein